MSFWNSLFGKKQKNESSPLPNESTSSKNSSQSRMERLIDQISILEKRQEVLNKKIDQEQRLAKEAMLKKNVPKAKMHLQRKKMHQDAIDRLVQQAFNLEEMRAKLEEAQCNVAYIKTQQEGTQALSETYGKLTVDKIDDIVDNAKEAIDKTNEISSAISQSLGMTSVDEGELDEELESLKQEVEHDELNKRMNAINVPPPALGVSATPATTVTTTSVPATAVKSPQSAEAEAEEALSQLEAELNG